MKPRLLFYLDSAFGETCAAIAFRSAWQAAVRHRASHALRRELRYWMRFYALRAVASARRSAARNAA